MNEADLFTFLTDLIVVLVAGFAAGTLCKRLGASPLIGYLAVGSLLGASALGWLSQENRELEYLARAGAMFLLFSIGIEFSPQELLKLNRYFLVGGATQMTLVGIPLTLVARSFGFAWNAAILAGLAGALSSTVLVFKALSDWGQTATPHGRRAIGVLLFQDVALVPLMLCLPLLTAGDDQPGLADYGWLALKSVALVVAVWLLRTVIESRLAPLLAALRSVELLVLFAMSLLGVVCWGTYSLGLPPAIGALATGFALGGNRLSRQIDAIVLPFRETFAAVFFVTLGALFDFRLFLSEPILMTCGVLGIVVLKAAAATVALRLTGLPWPAAAGMGLGLAQLGEFSFLLIAEGVQNDVIRQADYNRMLFIAMGTLIATPQLVKWGLHFVDAEEFDQRSSLEPHADQRPIEHAIVAGVGPVGRQIASRLEMGGVDVCLVDRSAVNLHPFAQQGFHTVAGDARDVEVLRRAHVERCRLIVVCVPDDDEAVAIASVGRKINPDAAIVVRCRYQASVERASRAGANVVVTEEAEAAGALLAHCQRLASQS